MDKNTLTGFILIAAVLIGFSYFSRPSEAEMEAQRRQDSIATVAQQKAQMAQEAKEEAEIAHQAQVALDTTSLFYAHRRGEAQNVVLENELIKLTFNTRGGTVQKVELKEYKNQQGGPVTLRRKRRTHAIHAGRENGEHQLRRPLFHPNQRQ